MSCAQRVQGAVDPRHGRDSALLDRRSDPGNAQRPGFMTVDEFTVTLREFERERGWERFHTPKNLAMALAGEAGELVAELQWLTPDESQCLSPGARQAVAAEMADVFIYLCRLADVLGVDLLEAASAKVELNRMRSRCPGEGVMRSPPNRSGAVGGDAPQRNPSPPAVTEHVQSDDVDLPPRIAEEALGSVHHAGKWKLPGKAIRLEVAHWHDQEQVLGVAGDVRFQHVLQVMVVVDRPAAFHLR